jgi:DNA-binding MurR/RpiR family transcriptional regulator
MAESPLTEADLRERIARVHHELTPQQQAVARALLESVRDLPFLSVPELAALSGASEATVVRFAQRLGYGGFAELRSELLHSLRSKLFSGSGRGLGEGGQGEELEATTEDTLDNVARLEIDNIRRSAEEIDREAFRRAALAVLRADHVFTFGLGISAHFAGLLAYLFGQIGIRATCVSTHLSSPLEALVSLRPSDLLAVFSFPPYSAQTIDLLRRAAADGIPTLAVTDRVNAPAALVARHAIPSRSENLMFTNAFAAVSVLVNAFAIEVGLRSREEAGRAVSSISRILEDDPNVIGDGDPPPPKTG